ncbi:MAG: autotransporter outer membrane beta-barrel domain-containing protein, partial [Opitutaceae bacterium]|nr:autotransporter outer membrane beta-barrel domain-containing protein [Opitutaceae bacterium]
MKNQAQNSAANRSLSLLKALPSMFGALCFAPHAGAADFTVQDGGTLPPVASLDATDSNTITLLGDASVSAPWVAGARQFAIIAGGPGPSTITGPTTTGSAFILITGPGTWTFDNIILTGGTTTLNGAGISYNGLEGEIIINGNIQFRNNTGRYGGGFGGGQSNSTLSITFGGDLIFENNTAQRGGGMAYSDPGPLRFMGAVQFLNNTSTTSHSGGLASVNASNSVTFESTAVFIGNHSIGSSGVGGAVSLLGDMTFMDSATFAGNTASGAGGALMMQTMGKSLYMKKTVIAVSNTAGPNTNADGGAFYLTGNWYIGGSSTFADNITKRNGGAIYWSDTIGVSTTGTFDAALGDITFRGNTMTGGSAPNAIYINSNAAATAGTLRRLVFDTSSGAGAHAISFYDPIAAHANAGAVEIVQNGSGLLLFDTYATTLNATATTTINSGTFRLTRGAIYGNANNNGAFTLAAPATLSGNGTVRAGVISLAAGSTLEALGGGALTLSHASALTGATGLTLLGSGTINAGGALSARTISVGTPVSANPDAPAAAVNSAQTLAFAGNTPVTLENGGVIHIDLFGSGTSDLLAAGTLTLAGSGTINFIGALDGSYKVITTANNLSTAGLAYTVNGGAVTGRYDTTLRHANAGAETWLDFAITNLAQTWTGAGGVWKNALTTDANWTDGGVSLPETFFMNGDRVLFGDTGAGTVTVDAAGVTAADMTVNAAAGYTFTGSGGITADTAGATGLAAPATGKLVKRGAGALNFANTGGNLFKGGIEIEAGVVAFTRADQLGDGGHGITFSSSGTLRGPSGTASLGNTLIVRDATATATVDVVAGGTLTHTGLIQAAAGAFVKSGGGTLVLGADNSAGFAATARVDGGALLLAQGAKLGGMALVSGGGIFGGSGSAAGITVLAGGTLQVGLPGAAGTLYAGALDLAAGATLNYTLLAGNQSSALQTAAAPVLAGGGIAGNYTININEWLAGSYALGNIAALEDATLTLRGDPLNARQLYTSATGAGGLLEITLLPTSNALLMWSGSNAAGVNEGRWNSTAENWRAGGASYAFADYDAVVFDDNVLAPGHRDVELMNTMIVSGMAVAGAGDYRFTGAGGVTGDASGAAGISGDGKLTKTGAGALVFANTGGNLFKGGIDIGATGTQGGVVAFDRAGQIAVGGGAAITFQSAGTLRALANITGAGAGPLDAAIAVAGGVNATLDTGAFEVAYSGALSGAGDGATLAKIGTGALRITGASSSANLTLDVTQGSLLLDGGSLGAAVSVRSGALLGGSGAVPGAAGAGVDAGATLRVGDGAGDGALDIAALRLAGSSTLTGRGTLSGAAAINGNVTADIAASTRLTLSATTGGGGTLTKTGAGTLVYSTASALGHAATGIAAGVVRLDGLGSLPISSGSHVFVLNGGWLDLSEGGVYDPTGDTAGDWSGLTLIGDSGRVIGSNDRITLRAGGAGFDIGSPDTGSKQGVFVVVDAGAGGVATMTGVNSYTGHTLLKSGVLQAGADDQLGLIDGALYREVVFDGGRLDIADGFTSGRAIELRAGGGVIGVPRDATAAWSGVTSGAGALVKDGAGTLVLTGAAGHDGGTVVTAGALHGNTISLQGNITNHGRLVFNQFFDGDFAGTIAGSGIVTKAGAGRLLLSGALSAAAFNLDAGTLVVPGGRTLATTQFNNNATLRIGRAGGAGGFGSVTIGGNYTGAGAQLFLGLNISGATVDCDRLHVAGNIDGDTTVDFGRIIVADPLPAGVLPDDIISWDGAAAPGAFTQSDKSVIEFGGVKYTWGINDAGGAGRWQADPVATAPAMLGADAAALLIGKAAHASLDQRMQFSRFNNRAHSLELWANGMHRHDKITSTVYDGMSADTQGVQVGGDWASVKADGNFLTVGAFYDYAKADLHLSADIADTRAESNGFGVYYTEKRGAWHTSVILRYAQADYQVSVPAWPSFTTKGKTYGFSAEAGRVFLLGFGENSEENRKLPATEAARLMIVSKKMMLQPQVQITGQHIEMDNATDPYGRHYRIYNTDSLEARAGALVSRDFQFSSQRTLTLYARGSLAYDFDGKSELHVASSTYGNSLGGGSVMVNAGASLRLARRVAAGLDAACHYGRETEGYSINLG